MQKKLLVTGFDPFDGADINPAWEAVKLLPDRIGEWEIDKLMIPTVFGAAPKAVIAKALEIRPNAIISVGQAGGRKAVTPERIGINLNDARIPDNEGNQPTCEPIIQGGPDGIFSTLPVERMAEAIKAAGYPAEVSNTAGTFVCNHLLYSLLNHFKGSEVKVCFIHVPYLPQQGEPNLPLEDTAKALEAAIACLE